MDMVMRIWVSGIDFVMQVVQQSWHESLYSLIWDFSAFGDSYKYKNMDKITQILENVVRCKYFEAGADIKNPIKNSCQDGLGRMTQILDHVVVVHILVWDNKKFQINEYSDMKIIIWRFGLE